MKLELDLGNKDSLLAIQGELRRALKVVDAALADLPNAPTPAPLRPVKVFVSHANGTLGPIGRAGMSSTKLDQIADDLLSKLPDRFTGPEMMAIHPDVTRDRVANILRKWKRRNVVQLVTRSQGGKDPNIYQKLK